MRKIATSLTLAMTLLFAGTALAGDHNQMQNDQGVFLAHHIGSHPTGGDLRANRNAQENVSPNLGSHIGSDSAEDNLHSAECGLTHKMVDHHTECGCARNDWGCDAEQFRGPHASQTQVLGVSNSLTATIIPAQVLVSNSSTTSTGYVCEDSAAVRHRNDTECFSAKGQFCVSKFDCQENCLSEASCFVEEGSGKAKFAECEGEHPIDACDCNLIDTGDLLDLDNDCDCLDFEDTRHHHDIADPEQDVENRINEQIRRTIGDILSEIVQNAFHQSFEDVIQMQ